MKISYSGLTVIKDNRKFCNGNFLKLNEDKIPLMRITTRQQQQANPEETVILDDVDENGEHVRPKETQRVLGVCLETSEKAILPMIRKKLGALWLVSKFLPRKATLKLANGLIIGRLCYGIQVWGTCTAKWVKRVQIVQNSAACYVLKRPRSMQIRILLVECK